MYEVRKSEKFKKGLHDLCKYIGTFHDTKNLSILEIGSFAGESTSILAQYFGKVYAVEPFRQDLYHVSMQPFKASQAEKDFDTRTGKLKNVIKIKNTSMGYAKECQEVFDVIYIDGCHDYDFVKGDIITWSEKIKLFVCGHDYLPLHSGVIKAVNEIYGKPDKVFCDLSWLKEVKC